MFKRYLLIIIGIIILWTSFSYAGQFVEYERVNLGYYNPETGKDILSIAGRHNRPGIDPFSHKGYGYPEMLKDKIKILRTRQKGNILLLELDITPEEASGIVEFKAEVKTEAEITLDWGIQFYSGTTTER